MWQGGFSGKKKAHEEFEHRGEACCAANTARGELGSEMGVKKKRKKKKKSWWSKTAREGPLIRRVLARMARGAGGKVSIEEGGKAKKHMGTLHGMGRAMGTERMLRSRGKMHSVLKRRYQFRQE